MAFLPGRGIPYHRPGGDSLVRGHWSAMRRLAVLAVFALAPLAVLGPLAAPPDAGPTAVTTSTVVGSPEPPPPYRVKRVYPHYSPSYPVMVKHLPGSNQLL